jgi:PAS domain S-box-containing protein
VREGEVYPMKELVDRNQFLEKLVVERTIQLVEVNEKLQKTNEELNEEIIEHTKAEEALQKSKQQYDNLVSQIPVGIYQMHCNTEGNLKLEFVSTRAAKMFNVGVENLLADFKIAFNSIHPDDLSLLNKLNQDGIKYQKPFDWKGRVILDGTVKWLHINSTPELLDNGDVLWHGLVVDITERMQAEEAMKNSEQKYRLLVDKANEAIVVVQNGFLQLANPMTLTMTGYSAEEIGVKPFHLFIHPDDRELVVGNYQKRLRGENVPSYYIFRLLNKDGSTRWVYMNGVLIEWEGSAATLNFLTDITELRLAEEALQKSSQKWEALIAVSPDGIGMISLDGKMLLMSDKLAEMYGYTMEEKDEIIGKPALDFIDPVDHKRLTENMGKLIAGERENQLSEYLAIRKDKSRFKIDINTTLLLDSNGKPSSILFVERDITERKNAEEEIIQKNLELAELNATKDKFFSIIAHDLKSPFQGLISYAQILSTQFSVLSEEEKISFIGGIEALSQSSYRLLENLLEWSRLQTGQMIYIPESINLLVELYPTISLVKQTALNKKIEFTYTIDNSIVVMADTNMLSTIIRNLVSNSIKFTNPGGSIILTAKKLNGFIEFSVSDTGIGIEKESLDKLFTIGNNESRKGTANEGGTGLGLLLCKEMIAKHDGEIRVKSEINKGTTFSFTIPS